MASKPTVIYFSTMNLMANVIGFIENYVGTQTKIDFGLLVMYPLKVKWRLNKYV